MMGFILSVNLPINGDNMQSTRFISVTSSGSASSGLRYAGGVLNARQVSAWVVSLILVIVAMCPSAFGAVWYVDKGNTSGCPSRKLVLVET